MTFKNIFKQDFKILLIYAKIEDTNKKQISQLTVLFKKIQGWFDRKQFGLAKS